MSRRKKNLRAFRHQHPANDMTVEETWNAAWDGAQKNYHSKRMQELEAELAELDNMLVVSHLGTLDSFESVAHAVRALVEFDLSAEKYFEGQQLAALKEAAQAEVDRQRHQCGILRQELQPTTAALASLLQEKGG